METMLSRLNESEKVSQCLDYYLFDERATEPVETMKGMLPFAQLEVAVRDRLYSVSEYLERTEEPADVQVERMLKDGLALLAKTAVRNDYPTDTVLYGELDEAVYRECIARLQGSDGRQPQDDAADTEAGASSDRRVTNEN